MANKEKKGMMFFYDWLSLFEELEDNEIGQLTRAIVKYAMTGECEEFADRSMRVVFKAMKNATDLANEKYESIGNARRDAAQKRWAKDANGQFEADANANDANAFFAQQSNANDALIYDTKLKENKQKENKLKENKRKATIDVNAAHKAIEERAFPYQVEQAVKQWIDYKHQRKEGYVSEGLKSLLTQIDNKVAEYGENAVADVIALSMSNQWKGIIWDKLNGNRNNGSSYLNRIDNRVSVVDSWVEQMKKEGVQ